MNIKRIAALFSAAVLCLGLIGCGEGVVFEERREPIENAIAALKAHDGEKLSDSYFSDNQVEYEAEIWSGVEVDEYYEIFSAYLERVDNFYKAKYGEDYVMEYTDGVLVQIEDENFQEINEKYHAESNGNENYYFNEGYIDSGTLTIKGSLGEDSEKVEVMLIKSKREGWKCYMTDTFFAHFYSESETSLGE